MLGDEGREIASSGSDAVGAVEGECGSWASERMLGYKGREMSASGNDAAEVPVEDECGSWAPERMLGDESREIASSGNDAAGVPVEDGFVKGVVWVVKARIVCWPAT